MQSPNTRNKPEQPRKQGKKLSTINEEFDFALFLLIVQKKWRWLLAILLVSIAIAIVYLRYAQRVYEESCTIQINSQNTANKVLENPGSNLLYQNSIDEVAEAMELMHSRIFIEKVIRSLPLAVSYYTEGTFKNYEEYLSSTYLVEFDTTALHALKGIKINIQWEKNSASGQLSYGIGEAKPHAVAFTFGQWFNVPEGKLKISIKNLPQTEKVEPGLKNDAHFFIINDIAKLAQEYSRAISIMLLNPDAKTIRISCSDLNDQKATDISNAVATEYIKYDVKKRSESAESVLSFIDDQLEVAYGRIKQLETSIDTFRTNNHINPHPELIAESVTRLSTLEDEITATDLDEKLLTHIQDQIKEKKDIDPIELLGLLSGSDYEGGLKDYLTTFHQLYLNRQKLSYDVTPNNQNSKFLDAQIESQKKLILQGIETISAKIKEKKDALTKQVDKMQTQILGSSSNDNIEYLKLQRLFSINEKYYDLLLEKKTEYQISKAGFVPASQVLENAIASWIPVSPRKSLSFTIAILVATIIGLIMLFIIYLFYNNISSLEEVERLAESPITILGIVPLYTKEIPSTQFIVNHNPKSILAESFRSIRTNLQFIANEDHAKIIAITSTISGEGKTFVSINLAGLIAYSGKKVIILDLDMRKPRIHTALKMDNSKGMSTLLIGKYTIEETVQKSEIENLNVITAGPIPPNPSELVISTAMDNVLEKLKKQYDIIIIDNPPVGLVTDGISMLQKADYPIYVMRADYSKREFISFIDRLYYKNQLHKLSLILNGVDLKRNPYGRGYYGYGYGYWYGYGYGHGGYYES